MHDDLIDDEGKRAIRQAQLIRGQIVTSYAQVEFMLADLAMRCSRRPEYAELVANFPYKLNKRIAAVKRIAAATGPISQYKAEIEPLVDIILTFEELRHFVVHGMLILKTQRYPGGEKHTLQFRRYDKQDGQLQIGFWNIELEKFSEPGLQIAQYSSRMMQLFKRIYLEQKLESV